jgi:hypothetical protein
MSGDWPGQCDMIVVIMTSGGLAQWLIWRRSMAVSVWLNHLISLKDNFKQESRSTWRVLGESFNDICMQIVCPEPGRLSHSLSGPIRVKE